MVEKVEDFALAHFGYVSGLIPLIMWTPYAVGVLWAKQCLECWREMSTLCLWCKGSASLWMLAIAVTLYQISCGCWYRLGYREGSGNRDW